MDGENTITITQEQYEKMNKLLEYEAKQKEARRLYMRKLRDANKEKVNEYKRLLYKKSKEKLENA